MTRRIFERVVGEAAHIGAVELMAVAVETDGPVFRPGTPQPLFDVRIVVQGH